MAIGVANFKIKLNGSDLPNEYMSAIESITVEDEINLPAMFSIQFNMIDNKGGKWRGIDLKAFKPGDKISISMGLDKVEELIKGEITSLELMLNKHSVLEIRGYDLLHRLRMGTKNKVFTKKKDSEIASEIAKEHGLSATVDDTKTIYPYNFQNNQSNYEFLLKKAEYLDYEIYVEDKKFYFVKSRAAKAATLPEFKFTKDFDELNLELKTLTKGSEVTVRGWDVKEKKEIEVKAKKGDETTKMDGKESGYDISSAVEASPITLWVENLVDKNEAQTAAKAAYNNLLKEFISGEGKCNLGNPLIRSGKSLKFAGLDDRFSGTYYIVSSVHHYDGKSYSTTFKVKRTGV